MHAARWFVTAAVIAAALTTFATPVGAQHAEVRAVLFFSPTCPHCHVVLEQHLPRLMDRFGDRLQVITINASTPDGGRLYQDMVEAYGVPPARLGVPALVVGDRLLVGSDEIPQLLPGIVTAGLAAGGIDWPNVSSIRGALARAGLLEPLPAPARTEVSAGATRGIAHASPVGGQLPQDVTEGAASSSMVQRFMRDPAGNAVAVLVLGGLVLTLAWSVYTVRSRARMNGEAPTWLIPVLVVCGMAVASYLSFVEVTGSTAVCGPVGDCNTVQQSPYATLLGFIPVGVLGLVGYAVIGGVWAVGRHGPPRWRRTATNVLWVAALAGTAFSAYLTFLEPFVIGASCAWCLTSAAVTAVILMTATIGVVGSRSMDRDVMPTVRPT
ncbi:MAG: vitamin K epoxide reductase [Gemmatimonadetes bacterium]|nr:vitamin K epoxide reductase [Gemmatimonadota bacterium]